MGAAAALTPHSGVTPCVPARTAQSLCHGLVAPSPAPPPPLSAPAAQHWRALQARSDALAAFRDAALDKWHARAVLASGSATLQGSLRALNQSVSKQVATVMQDPTRLINRSRLLRDTAPRRLGVGPSGADAASLANGHGGQEEDEEEEEGRQGGRRRGGADERDEETFDDGEFYQQLLKEFLEQGGADGAALAAARAAKKRKVVDRRASKGRKIRCARAGGTGSGRERGRVTQESALREMLVLS